MRKELIFILFCFSAIAILVKFEYEKSSSMIQGVKPGISNEKAKELLGNPGTIESAESAILGTGDHWNYREKELDLFVQNGVVRAIWGGDLVLPCGTALLKKGDKLVHARKKLEGLVLQETHESIFFDQNNIRTIIHVHDDSIAHFELVSILRKN